MTPDFHKVFVYARIIDINNETLEAMHDFAGRGEVNYSFQLMFARPMR